MTGIDLTYPKGKHNMALVKYDPIWFLPRILLSTACPIAPPSAQLAAPPSTTRDPSSAFPFLRLPPELQCMVCDHLLIARRKPCKNRPREQYTADLGLLQVNKTLHSEWSRWFHDQNGWVMFHDRSGVLKALLEDANTPINRLPNPEAFGRDPELKISLSHKGCPPCLVATFVVPLSEAADVCRWLMVDERVREESLLRAEFNVKATEREEKLQRVFNGVCQMKQVVVEGMTTGKRARELTRKMKGVGDGVGQYLVLGEIFCSGADRVRDSWRFSGVHQSSLPESALILALYSSGAESTTQALERYRTSPLPGATVSAIDELRSLRDKCLYGLVSCTSYSVTRRYIDVMSARNLLLGLLKDLRRSGELAVVGRVLIRLAKEGLHTRDNLLALLALVEALEVIPGEPETMGLITELQEEIVNDAQARRMFEVLVARGPMDMAPWSLVSSVPGNDVGDTRGRLWSAAIDDGNMF